jgi:hypothetical protein
MRKGFVYGNSRLKYFLSKPGIAERVQAINEEAYQEQEPLPEDSHKTSQDENIE